MIAVRKPVFLQRERYTRIGCILACFETTWWHTQGLG
jgi:hypothetical protein